MLLLAYLFISTFYMFLNLEILVEKIDEMLLLKVY